MVNISPRSTGGPATDDPSWLYGPVGVDANLTVTLDVTAFVEATHYPDGFIPSGTPLGLITATRLYGPYTTGAVNGLETCAGFLYAPLEITDGSFAAPASVVGALYHQGVVQEANLPIAIDAPAKVDLTLVTFV